MENPIPENPPIVPQSVAPSLVTPPAPVAQPAPIPIPVEPTPPTEEDLVKRYKDVGIFRLDLLKVLDQVNQNLSLNNELLAQQNRLISPESFQE